MLIGLDQFVGLALSPRSLYDTRRLHDARSDQRRELLQTPVRALRATAGFAYYHEGQGLRCSYGLIVLDSVAYSDEIWKWKEEKHWHLSMRWFDQSHMFWHSPCVTFGWSFFPDVRRWLECQDQAGLLLDRVKARLNLDKNWRKHFLQKRADW